MSIAGLKDRIVNFTKEHRGFRRAYVAIGSVAMKLWGHFVPQDDRMILFVSYNGKRYNDSPRAIYEYMREHYPSLNLHYVWAFDNPDRYLYLDAELIASNSLSYFYHALKAKYWVTNVNIERALSFKRPGTIYLNTYHATAVKKDGRAAGHEYADYSNVDILCANSHFNKDKLVEEYDADPNKVLLCGRPREDALYQVKPTSVLEKKRLYGLPLDKKIILYAPTWREGQYSTQAPPINLAKWEAVLGGQYVVLYRAHHYSMAEREDGLCEGFLFDGTAIEDVNDAYVVSDILISDYSSVFVDYSILERPMFCFAYDYNEYSQYRGLSIDVAKEFSDLAYTEDELLNDIVTMDYAEKVAQCKRFKSTFAEFGGHATETCVSALLSQMDN